MIHDNELNNNLTEPVLKSLYLLREHILNYDPNENSSVYKILQELLTFRRSWRDLSTFLEEIDSKVNEEFVNKIRETELCYYEYEERLRFANFLIKYFEDNIHPAFEMYVQNKMIEDNDLNTFASSINDSFQKIYDILDRDLRERKEKEKELESKLTENSSLRQELKSINQQMEELNKQLEPIKNNIDVLSNYLTDKKIKELGNFSLETMMQLSTSLRPIYICFNLILDKIDIERNEKVMGIFVNNRQKLNIIINKPIKDFFDKVNSKTYTEFLERAFPIRLECSEIKTSFSQEILLLSVYNKEDQPFKYHIFSDILFEKSHGKDMPFIDHVTMDILPEDSCGTPYYWLQYLANNGNIIPINLDETEVNKRDIFTIIELRIHNFLFFCFFMHLISSAPQFLRDFMEYNSENKINIEKDVNFDIKVFDIEKVHEKSDYSFNIHTDEVLIKLRINLDGNISYFIQKDGVSIQERYLYDTEKLSKKNILRYNQDLIKNFCSELHILISN